MTRILNVTVLVLLAGLMSEAHAQTVIRGVVRSDAGESLASAHVVIQSSGEGTVTNLNGEFELPVRVLPVVLEVRHIGFRTARVLVDESNRSWVIVELESSVYSLDEIIVADRDFAENVMRKVIRRKQEWSAKIPPYRARGYTRITLDNRDEVTAIHEAVFDLYGSRCSESRAVIRSIRETSQIHEELDFRPAGMPLANFLADTVFIHGLSFIAPTHPDALEYYNYSFARTRSIDDRSVYDLYLSPRNASHPTFIGIVSVLADEHTMIGVEVRPARFVNFPLPVAAWDVFYHQQFFSVDSLWVPVDLRLTGTFVHRNEVREVGPVGLNQTSLFTSYSFGERPDSLLLAGEDIAVLDQESIERDYLFAQGMNIIPLTPRETVAILQLSREPMTLSSAYPPRRPRLSANMIRPSFPLPYAPQFDWPRVAGYQLSAGLNRVDGYRTGIGTTWPLSRDLYLEWRLTQAFSLDEVRYLAGLTRLMGQHLWLRALYSEDSAPSGAAHVYPRAMTSLATQLGGPDYYDYYWSRDARVEIGGATRFGRARLQLRDERSEPLAARLATAWPHDRDLGENPAVDSSRVTTLAISLTLGDRYVAFRSRARNGLTVVVERSVDVSDGIGHFTAARVMADAFVKTLYGSRLEPNGLHFRLSAGTSTGSLPLQRYGGVNTSLRGFSTLGVLRARPERPIFAEHYLVIAWEHDFRGMPLEWLGLDRSSESGVGLRLTGAHARTWGSSRFDDRPDVANEFHHEIGISVTTPFRIPLRLDVTVRLNDGRPFFGFGVGRF